MDSWKLIVLFLCAFTGGICVFIFKNNNTKTLKLILSFSGSYLFAITILHLLPDVYNDGQPDVGLFILGGFIFQILLEQFSEGIEHGHIHTKHHHHVYFPYGIIISLSIHAFLEGMPLVQKQQNQLVFGIAIHHIPAAFALGSILVQNQVKKHTIIILLIVFALMSPLGYLFSKDLGYLLTGNLESYFSRIMGIVIGIFLHISTTILFESSIDHHFTIKKMIAVSLGISIAIAGFLIH